MGTPTPAYSHSYRAVETLKLYNNLTVKSRNQNKPTQDVCTGYQESQCVAWYLLHLPGHSQDHPQHQQGPAQGSEGGVRQVLQGAARSQASRSEGAKQVLQERGGCCGNTLWYSPADSSKQKGEEGSKRCPTAGQGAQPLLSLCH